MPIENLTNISERQRDREQEGEREGEEGRKAAMMATKTQIRA